jgi:hypothetical protein
MIAQSRAHLRSAGEGYWQHFRFATTFGLLAMAAGFAAILHAFIPAFCTSTASRIIRHLGNLLEDRSRIDAIENEAVEARAFVMLLMLATVAIAPLWILDAPTTLRVAYTVLAYALPAALMISNPELITTEEHVA